MTEFFNLVPIFSVSVLSRRCFYFLSFFSVSLGARPSRSEIQRRPYVVEGVSDTIAYGLGRSLRINGTAKGAFALGGDVIVHGTVEGDVAAIGGSVIQLEGSRIDGDVMVVGGNIIMRQRLLVASLSHDNYIRRLRRRIKSHHALASGFLRAALVRRLHGLPAARDSLLVHRSLALTAAIPGTISRGIARLQLTLGRVAIIGVLEGRNRRGCAFSLHYLPFHQGSGGPDGAAADS